MPSSAPSASPREPGGGEPDPSGREADRPAPRLQHRPRDQAEERQGHVDHEDCVTASRFCLLTFWNCKNESDCLDSVVEHVDSRQNYFGACG